MEVQLPGLLGNYDGQTNRPTRQWTVRGGYTSNNKQKVLLLNNFITFIYSLKDSDKDQIYKQITSAPIGEWEVKLGNQPTD